MAKPVIEETNQFRQSGTLLRNPWDEVFLCDHCAEALRAVAATLPEETAPTIERPDDRRLVYFIGTESGPIKVGVAAVPEVRLRELQTGHPFKLTVLATCEGGNAKERAYHKRFAAHRLQGEWFARVPEIEAEIARLHPPTTDYKR